MTLAAPAGTPFRLGTRQIRQHLATRDFVPGQTGAIRIPLKKYGYLKGLLIWIRGTLTIGASTPDERPGFPYNILGRAFLDLPGVPDPVSVSGYSLFLQDRLGYHRTMQRHGFDALAKTAAQSSAHANAFYDSDIRDVYDIATGAARNWRLALYLPAVHNVRDIRGAQPVAGDADVELQLFPGALGDIFDATAQVTANDLDVEVYQDYFTAPLAWSGVQAPDTRFAIVLDEYSQSVGAVGDVDIKVPKDNGVILNITHAVWLDDDAYPAAPEPSIESLSLSVGRDKLLDALPARAWFEEQQKRYFEPLPSGVIAYDQDFLQPDLPYLDSSGHERIPGWIFAEAGKDIESRIRIASGATLDNARIVTCVKRLMPV